MEATEGRVRLAFFKHFQQVLWLTCTAGGDHRNAHRLGQKACESEGS